MENYRGTNVFKEFKIFCRRNGITFQSVRYQYVNNLSHFFWLNFYDENKLSIYSLREKKYRHYTVYNLTDLLAVLCDPFYKILDSEYLVKMDVRTRPLSYYEFFKTPLENSSCTLLGVNISYTYSKC